MREGHGVVRPDGSEERVVTLERVVGDVSKPVRERVPVKTERFACDTEETFSMHVGTV